MATERWVVVKTQWCDILQKEAQLLERRAYPHSRMPDMEVFRVLGRRCSEDITCNMIGCTCKWAYTGDEVDRFALE